MGRNTFYFKPRVKSLNCKPRLRLNSLAEEYSPASEKFKMPLKPADIYFKLQNLKK